MKARRSGGSVQGILGAVTAEDPGGPATLNVDDSADATGRTVTLGTITPSFDPVPWGSITGLAPAAINFEWADVNSPVNISTSAMPAWYVDFNSEVPNNGGVAVYDNGDLINA